MSIALYVIGVLLQKYVKLMDQISSDYVAYIG
jgi:hypothetical protein